MRPIRGLAACLAAAFAGAGGACSQGASPAPPEPQGHGGAAPGGPASHAASSAVASVGSGPGGAGELPPSFTVTGVVTDGSAPLAGATVMQGGGAPVAVTGPDGAFSIELTRDIPGAPAVVAAKIGYRSGGLEIDAVPTAPIAIELRRVSPRDNTVDYRFGDPGRGDAAADSSTRYCGHCHTTLTAQFQASAHARATRNPLVQAVYAGVSAADTTEAACLASGGLWRDGRVPGTPGNAARRCYLGAGVLPDLNPSCGGAAARSCDDPALPAGERPTAFGGCADCHAAGLDGQAGGRDLLDATGVAYENGDHCDACHKVADIDLTRPPGVAGALVMRRPIDRVSDAPGAPLVPVMFGPNPDVPTAFMGGSFQPKFSTSAFCGGCHEQKQAALLPGMALDPARWPGGLPIHETFSEWSGGPWNTTGTPCQSCHMPEIEWLKNSVDVTTAEKAGITFGFVRPPGDVRSHVFRGPLQGAPRLVRDAVTLTLTGAAVAGELRATLRLHNVAAGHAVPTGEPMRALVLVVTASACGAAMEPSSGMTVDDTGGVLAEGRVGDDATLAGDALAWPAGAARARAGDVVRVVRPTGVYDDYVGIGLFADRSLSATEKGLELRTPVGEATVVSAGSGSILLRRPIAARADDVVVLGEALAAPPRDAQASAALAGAAGYTFAKVLVDPTGARHAPQHRAVDIASDNRIAPGGDATTAHGFAIPAGCPTATITATLLYRPIPLAFARERGFAASDYVIASTRRDVPLPP